jgi:hypothetical protein
MLSLKGQEKASDEASKLLKPGFSAEHLASIILSYDTSFPLVYAFLNTFLRICEFYILTETPYNVYLGQQKLTVIADIEIAMPQEVTFIPGVVFIEQKPCDNDEEVFKRTSYLAIKMMQLGKSKDVDYYVVIFQGLLFRFLSITITKLNETVDGRVEQCINESKLLNKEF